MSSRSFKLNDRVITKEPQTNKNGKLYYPFGEITSIDGKTIEFQNSIRTYTKFASDIKKMSAAEQKEYYGSMAPSNVGSPHH